MWVCLAAVWAVWAVATASEAECPAECLCSVDGDGLWAGECTGSVLNSWPPPPPSPSLESLRLKPRASCKTPSEVRIHRRVLSFRFRNLRVLRITHACLDDIPRNSISDLTSLEILDLSNNRLRNLQGVVLYKLLALKTLLLRANPSLSLSNSDTLRSRSLRELDLGECNLSALPSLQYLPLLQRLALDGNRLTSFDPYALPQALRTLDLTRNLLADVPQALQKLKHLKHVDLRKNPVVCTCELLRLHDYLSGKGAILEALCSAPKKVAGQSLARVDEDALCRDKLNERMLGDQPADSETLFSNHETRQMGTHMEAMQSSLAESLEASGDGPLDTSLGTSHESFEFEGSGEYDEGTSTPADDSAFFVTARSYSAEDLTSGSNETDVPDEGSMTDNVATEETGTDHDDSLFPMFISSHEPTSTTEESVISSSTTDQNMPWASSTHESSEEIISDELEGSSTTEEIFSGSSSTEGSSELVISGDETSSMPSSTTEDIFSVLTSEPGLVASSSSGDLVDIESSTSEPITVKSTEDITFETSSSIASVHLEPVVTDSTTTSTIPPESSSADLEALIIAKNAIEVEGATEASAAAAGATDYSSMDAILISAAVVGPLAVLGAAAAWRRRRRSTPRKIRLEGGGGGGGGTGGAELQDMGPLLPQPQPAQILPQEERPLSNGSAPVRATARLTVLPDSVPRTPVFLHKPAIS